MFRWFVQHPDVFVPAIKEPHYFSCPDVLDTYYDAAFVQEEHAYLGMYRDRTEARAGDFSSSYLYRHEAADRIAAVASDAKIVVVLRNPIDRAISHHRMDVRDGYTDARLISHLKGEVDDERFRREYIDVGMYSEQLSEWEKAFSSDQIHIALYDDLVSNPELTIGGICGFLGITAAAGGSFTQRANVASAPHRPFVRRIASSSVVATAVAKLPPGFGYRLSSAVSRPAQPVDPTALEFLNDCFTEEIDRLEHRLDRDLSHWLNTN